VMFTRAMNATFRLSAICRTIAFVCLLPNLAAAEEPALAPVNPVDQACDDIAGCANARGCHDWCFQGGCCERGISVRVDGLLLNRESARDRLLVADVPSLNPRITAADLDFDLEFGLRASAIWDRTPCVSWEFAYLRDDWDAAARATSPTGLSQISAGPGDAYNWANDISVRYGTDLDSFEINRYRKMTDRFSWLAGFRAILLDESFLLVSVDENGGGPGLATGTYGIDTSNELLGFQVGGVYSRSLTDLLSFDGVLKAGVYYVESDLSVDFTDEGNFPNPPVAFQTSDYTTAFVGEIDLGLSCKLTRRLSVRGGLELLWIEGVALAPEQYQMNYAMISPATAINTGGGFLAYGGSVSLVGEW